MPAGIKAQDPDLLWKKTLDENEFVDDAWFSEDDSLLICHVRAYPDTGYIATYNSYTGSLVKKIMYNSKWAVPAFMEISYKDTILLVYSFFGYYPDTSNFIEQKLTLINYMTGELVDSLIPSEQDVDLKWDTCRIRSMTFSPDYEKLFMVADIISHYRFDGFDSIPVYEKKLFVWNTDNWTIERKRIFNNRYTMSFPPNRKYYSYPRIEPNDEIYFDDYNTDTTFLTIYDTDSISYYPPFYPKTDTTKFLNFIDDWIEHKLKLQIRNQSDLSVIKTIVNDTLQHTIDENITNDCRYLIFRSANENILKGHNMIFDLEKEEIVYVYNEIYWHLLGKGGYPFLIVSNNSKLIFDCGTRENYMLNAKYTITSIMNGNDEPNSVIYPNPATDYIDVMLNEVKHPFLSVKIYDILGVCVGTHPLAPSREGESVRLDVSGLSPGVYFVRVGGRMYKFVKM